MLAMTFSRAPPTSTTSNRSSSIVRTLTSSAGARRAAREAVERRARSGPTASSSARLDRVRPTLVMYRRRRAPNRQSTSHPRLDSRITRVVRAHVKCCAKIVGFLVHTRDVSNGASNNARGRRIKCWSRGPSKATYTESARPSRRPARPACCQSEATNPESLNVSRVERSDVDAELERVRRRDSEQCTRKQFFFDDASL